MAAGSQLDTLTRDQLEQIFKVVGSAKTADSARDWQSISDALNSSVNGGGSDAPPKPLKAMQSDLTSHWEGDGADAFTNKLSQVGKWTTDYASLLGGGVVSVAGLLHMVAQAQQNSYKFFQTTQNSWNEFTKAAAAYFNSLNGTVDPRMVAAPPGGLTNAGFTTSPMDLGNGIKGTLYTWQVFFNLNGYEAKAIATASTTQKLKVMFLEPGAPPYDGAPPVFTGDLAVNGTVDSSQVDQANVDQYMSDLRYGLNQLGQVYVSAANQLPTAKNPPLSTATNPAGGGGSGPQYTGGPGTNVPVGANVPLNKNGSNVPVNNGVNNGQNSPLTSANGANSPLTSANGANSNVPLSQSGVSPTSLASAPVTTPPGLNSGLNSGAPTGTAGLGSVPPITGGTGSLPGLGNAGSGLPMFVPPVAGGILPNSDLGGLPGEFGGAGGSGLSDGALTDGGFGANGELNPGATGALGEGALAAEVAPGVAASELGAAAKGAPMMPFFPMSPMMGGADGGDRKRTAWLDEDEDIWAADTDPAPAVIGGGEQ